jgi:hypothetical protein
MSMLRLRSTATLLKSSSSSATKMPFRQFVAFHQVIPFHRLAVLLADTFHADGRHVGAVEQTEVWCVIARAHMQLDRDIDESKADRPFP